VGAAADDGAGGVANRLGNVAPAQQAISLGGAPAQAEQPGREGRNNTAGHFLRRGAHPHIGQAGWAARRRTASSLIGRGAPARLAAWHGGAPLHAGQPRWAGRPSTAAILALRRAPAGRASSLVEALPDGGQPLWAGRPRTAAIMALRRALALWKASLGGVPAHAEQPGREGRTGSAENASAASLAGRRGPARGPESLSGAHPRVKQLRRAGRPRHLCCGGFATDLSQNPNVGGTGGRCGRCAS